MSHLAMSTISVFAVSVSLIAASTLAGCGVPFGFEDDSSANDDFTAEEGAAAAPEEADEDCTGTQGGRAYLDRCGTCIDRDGSEAVAIWSDDTARSMTADCTEIRLPTVMLAEGIRAHVQAGSTAISDAYVYLRDAEGNDVGTIQMNPENHGELESTVTFDKPVEVESLRVCSWWNPATLLDVTILGNENACRGDCLGHWPTEGAYRDTCGACIERQEKPDVLYYDGADRAMTSDCVEMALPRGYLVEELYANVQNAGGGISNAWVYLVDANGTEVGSLNLQPEYGGYTSGTKVLDAPVAATTLRLCSWWNDARLLDVQLSGNGAACMP